MGRTGNDDLVPSVTLDNAGDRLELTLDDGHGLVGFALFEGFTDAGNDGETGVDGGLGLIKRFFGGVSELWGEAFRAWRRTLSATNLSVSPNKLLLSECPKITQWTFASFNC